MAARILLAVLALAPLSADPGASYAPYYTPDSVANTAAGIAGFYAPDMFISIYGQNLAHVTRAMTLDDIASGALPTALIGAGVRVLINNIAADIWYVSPTLVNLLVPTSLIAGPATIQLVDDGVAGPPIAITLGETAPSLFQVDATTVLGVHVDGSLITSAAPASAGELIVLYATGLGPTNPASVPNQVPTQAARVTATDFQVMLNGSPIEAWRVQYAGVTPGYAGLFQINLQLPDDAPPNPEIRIGAGGRISPPGRYLLLL